MDGIAHPGEVQEQAFPQADRSSHFMASISGNHSKINGTLSGRLLDLHAYGDYHGGVLSY